MSARCGAVVRGNVYQYTSPMSKESLKICNKCAIREYYGTKGKASKKWRMEKEIGKIFGRLLE